MNFIIITLFPEVFPGTLGISVAGKSLGQNFSIQVCNLKEYGLGKYKQVDDEVFGGGSGMLIRADVLSNAIEACLQNFPNAKIIFPSPRGILFNQKIATQMSQSYKDIIIICGRFEGIDNRILEYYNVEEISIGNYVLFGGELAAMCIMESTIRLLPGVCGNHESIQEESFSVGTPFENLVEYSQYTRPATWNGIKVPDVLTSGNHKKIQEWRLKNAQELTKERNKK